MRQETNSGLLSLRDQQYLNQATTEQKQTEKGEIDRTRIQEEIYHGLIDFILIDSDFDNEDRRKLFDRLPEDRDLQNGIESTLSFLYRGLEDTGHDFEDFLTSGLQRPVGELLFGQITRNGKDGPTLELEPKFFDVNREPDEYTDEELGLLLYAGQIDGAEALDILKARKEREDNE